MNILHYMLGKPPVRNGGLIKYVLDLASEERDLGHHVALLTPGVIKLFQKSTVIVKSKSFLNNIDCYEIVNPLPIPMANGIQDIELYTQKSSDIPYKEFLNQLKPDIIHVHSLMGLHREFLEEAKKNGIKIVFTSHDYFGICPKTDLLCGNEICVDKDWTNCQKCCQNAFSYKRVVFEQSKIFKYYKQMIIMEKIKKNKQIFQLVQILKKKRNKKITIENNSVTSKIDYSKLKKYYEDMFGYIDIMIYNSNISKSIYEERIGYKKNYVLNVYNKEIKDQRKEKKFGKILNIAYLGNNQYYKGYPLLKETLDEVYQEGYNDIILNVFFEEDIKKSPYIKYNGKYSYNELERIMDNTDIVIVPSVWRETFGFVALEAISFGVPILVTENVGAIDLINENPGIGYVSKANKENLRQVILQIYKDRSILVQANQRICKADINFSFAQHVRNIIDVYSEC